MAASYAGLTPCGRTGCHSPEEGSEGPVEVEVEAWVARLRTAVRRREMVRKALPVARGMRIVDDCMLEERLAGRCYAVVGLARIDGPRPTFAEFG